MAEIRVMGGTEGTIITRIYKTRRKTERHKDYRLLYGYLYPAAGFFVGNPPFFTDIQARPFIRKASLKQKSTQHK